MSTLDVAITPSGERRSLSYAGLVLEMLGLTRWHLPTTEEESPRAAMRIAAMTIEEALAVANDEPMLIEVVRSPETVPFPLEIHLRSSLESRVRPSVGLYSSSPNYSGIRGIGWPLRVETQFLRKRHRPRRKLALSPPANPIADEAPKHAFVVRAGEPLVWLDDERALVTRCGRSILLGLPLLSLLVTHLTVPSLCSDEYQFSEPVHHLLLLLDALIGEIEPPGVLRVRPWPHDQQGVASIRHDLDRPTDLREVTRREKEAGIRPTVFLLADSLPDRGEAEVVLDRGGEIGVHGRWLDHLAAERSTVEAFIEREAEGHTCHGGEGDGWQGLINLLAAHDAGFRYTELLSEMHIWPHRLPDPSRPGIPLEPIALPHHLSFDVRRGEHAGERLALEAPRVLANRGHLTLMNHPDINFDEFLDLLTTKMPEGIVWMTLGEVAAWWRATHTRDAFEATVELHDETLVEVHGRATEAQIGAVLSIELPEGSEGRSWRVSRGAAGARITTEAGGVRLEWTLDRDATKGYRITAQV